MSIEPEYKASESSMMEHLLTDHPCASDIAELPDQQIQRLRSMLRNAIQQHIAPTDVYDAITRGFENVFGASVLAPPLAYNLSQPPKTKEEALLALMRELEGTE